ncbi:MAG: hypothetical protein VX278_21800 [Myxococcota bacterium]|nr:hypothetical protein [Myxococcota bacterium]
MNDRKTIVWWKILSALAMLNIIAWIAVASQAEVGVLYVRWHLMLSAVFTAVCAFRSFLPRIDLERYCLVDSFASSMVVGRSAATIAEVSFATQVALLIHEMGNETGILWVQSFSAPIVILLFTAQIFCWSSVISLNHIGHAIEESIWALTFAMVGVCFAVCIPQLEGLWRNVSILGLIACVGYVCVMVIVDVPMYAKRWRKGQREGESYLGFRDGWSDALNRRVVTRDWKIWKPEVAWLTGYFTMAVWISLAMVLLPRAGH